MNCTNSCCVSVVVPVRNERSNIEGCLKRLSSQTYPHNKYEILIVDGVSEDKTREIVNGFINNDSASNIKLLDNPKKQRASALNVGIRQAKGDVIIRIDARTEIPPDYIEKCVQTLVQTGADNVGGVQKPRWVQGPNGLTQKAIGIALSHPFGIGNAQFRLGLKSGYVDTVYLGCFRKEIFDKVGLFDENSPVISEDSDMNFRIRKAGGKIYLNKNIIAYYYPRDNLKDLWKLYFRYGGAKAGNLIKNKKLTAWRQFVPPLFILTLVVLALISLFDRYAFYLLVCVLTIYFSVNLIASFLLTLKNKKISLLPRLFTAFPTLHFSWGLGFFRRLLQRPKPGQYWSY